ncbi:hypothetical protein RFI_31826, partial [Reticulomyxa filosa]
MLQFETDEEEKVKLDNISLEDCYNKHWISLLNKEETVNKFICLLCKQVAYNAVELSCREHENMEEFDSDVSPTVSNDTWCEAQSDAIGTMEDDEGSNVNEYNLSQKQGCNYRGTIKGLKEHLETSCRLKPVYCCFQKFVTHASPFAIGDNHIRSLQQKIFEKDCHIQHLQQKILEKNYIQHLILAKDDQIQHLQTQLQMQQTELTKLRAENAAQVEEIGKLRVRRGGRGGRGRDRDVNRGRDNLSGKNWIEQQRLSDRTGRMRQEGRHFKNEDFRIRGHQYGQEESAAVTAVTAAKATLLVDDNVLYHPFSSQKERQRHDQNTQNILAIPNPSFPQGLENKSIDNRDRNELMVSRMKQDNQSQDPYNLHGYSLQLTQLQAQVQAKAQAQQAQTQQAQTQQLQAQ